MEQDGFTLVKKKKSFKLRKLKESQISKNEAIDVKSSCKRILAFKSALSSQNGVANFLELVKDKYSEPSLSGASIICYGLGRVSSCRIAQVQFAFLLMLKDSLNGDAEAYDPVFSASDQTLLRTFDVQLIKVNEKAKRTVQNKKVIFYMPHCDLFLYNNLLWSNWCEVNLKNIAIIGNSFEAVISDHISRKLETKYTYVSNAAKFSNEYSFPKIDDFYEVFNNISLIDFSQCSILDKTLWNISIEPTYSDDEK